MSKVLKVKHILVKYEYEAQDIYKKLINPKADDEKLQHLSKIYSVGIAIVAIALSILYPKALDWVIATYAFSAAGLLFPIFAGILLKDNKID